jgi:hypothetical protein
MAKRLRIIHVAIAEHLLPINDDYYPGMTPEQAASQEQNKSEAEILDDLCDAEEYSCVARVTIEDVDG